MMSRFDLRDGHVHQPLPERWDFATATELDGEGASRIAAIEALAAELTRKPAAMMVPSGTIGKALALRDVRSSTRCVLLEEKSQIFWVDRLHKSKLLDVAPRLARGDRFGGLLLAEVEEMINGHPFGREAPVICLETAHYLRGGTVLRPAYVEAASALARRHSTTVFLDGMRLLDGAFAQAVPLHAFTKSVDRLVIALDDVDAVFLCGSAEFVEETRAFAKQMGLPTPAIPERWAPSATLPARSHALARVGVKKRQPWFSTTLRGKRERFDCYHRRARRLGELLAELPGLSIDLETVQTRVVRVGTGTLGRPAATLARRLEEQNVLTDPSEPFALLMTVGPGIGEHAIDAIVTRFAAVLAAS